MATGVTAIGAAPVLEKGMEGTAIIQAVGKPAQVLPLKSAEGKAEKWIYRRKLDDRVTQTEATQAFIPAMIGIAGDGKPMIGTAIVPDYRLKHIVVYQVTALLLLDGKLQLGRQWLEQEEKFTN